MGWYEYNSLQAKRGCHSYSLELELQALVSQLTWVLETKLEPFAGAECALKG